MFLWKYKNNVFRREDPKTLINLIGIIKPKYKLVKSKEKTLKSLIKVL